MINLDKDFQDIVIKYGEEKGLVFSDCDRKQAVIRILNFYRKIGVGNKKVVSYARNIQIPKKWQKRVKSILKYLSKGEDITPYLSTQSINLDCQQDLMFNDWNILHIHLGKKPHINNSRFIERTGELLFCYIQLMRLEYLVYTIIICRLGLDKNFFKRFMIIGQRCLVLFLGHN